MRSSRYSFVALVLAVLAAAGTVDAQTTPAPVPPVGPITISL